MVSSVERLMWNQEAAQLYSQMNAKCLRLLSALVHVL